MQSDIPKVSSETATPTHKNTAALKDEHDARESEKALSELPVHEMSVPLKPPMDDVNLPPSKRRKSDDQNTPTVKSDDEQGHDLEGKPSHVRRSGSSASVNSDLSNASSGHMDERVLSPVPPSFRGEVPPAPPSTPASLGANYYADVGSATPLPMAPEVSNASQLEHEQYLAEGAATPAPTGKKQVLQEDFSEWAVGDRYELMRVLGRGSYGEVAQARDLFAPEKDTYVAIKRIQSPFDQEIDAIRIYREMHILRRMRGHECIIQLVDVVQPPTDDLDDFHDLYLVFEYVDTDLYKLIMSPQYLTTEHIQTFLYQILAGLKYIHSFSVIHRDLKPANILLNEDCSLKICDFGLARIVDTSKMSSGRSNNAENDDDEDDDENPFARKRNSFGSPPKVGLTRQLTKHVVTRWYRAPELILVKPYTSAVDIWSVGCILGELLSMMEGNVSGYQERKPLFPGGSCYPLSGEGDSIKADERLDQLSVIFGVIGTPPKEDLDDVGESSSYIKSLGQMKGKSFEKLFPTADPLALDLLRQMLSFNPDKRLTAAEALEHKFFEPVRRKDLEVNADSALIGPDFLNSDKVDVKKLKQQVFQEVLWYRDHKKAAPKSNA